MPGTLSPFVKFTAWTNAGAAAAAHKLFTYSAGTTNKLGTFSDADLLVANANPIVLDSSGRATIFLTPGATYKYVLAPSTDTDPPTSPIWTVDGIQSVPLTTVNTDVVAIAGEALVATNCVYLADGTEGGTSAGRWYKTDADFAYASTRAKVIGFVVTDIASGAVGSVRVGGKASQFSSLTAGANYYVSATAGAVTATEPVLGTRLRLIGTADSITSIMLAEKAKAQVRERVAAFIATVGNVGIGEDTLREYIAPAGEMAADLMTYTVVAWGKTASNANVKNGRLRMIEGANNTELINFVFTAAELGHWSIEATVIRSAATTARAVTNASVGPQNGPVSRAGVSATAYTATWANAVTIRLTGEATADNDITCEGMTVYLRE